MKQKLRWFVGTMLVGVVIVAVAAAMRQEDAVTRLRSEDAMTREQAAEEILQKRRKLIADIGQIVKDFKDTPARKETVKTSIMLLGKLRAVEAIPLLIDNLLLYGAEKVDFQPAEGSYPCIDALIDVGSPAIDALCVKAESTDDEADARNRRRRHLAPRPCTTKRRPDQTGSSLHRPAMDQQVERSGSEVMHFPPRAGG